MWTDLAVDLVVLAIACANATSFFILAVSNCGYIIFNFLNLNAGWIHRMDSGHIARPYRAPSILIALGALFAYANAVFMGAGAKVWNPSALWRGLITAALIVPAFWYRHYLQDGGKLPAQMLEDLEVGNGQGSVKRSGALTLPDAGGEHRRGAGVQSDFHPLTRRRPFSSLRLPEPLRNCGHLTVAGGASGGGMVPSKPRFSKRGKTIRLRMKSRPVHGRLAIVAPAPFAISPSPTGAAWRLSSVPSRPHRNAKRR